MKVLLLVAIIVVYVLSYLSYCNEWEWFWILGKALAKIVEASKMFVFIKTFPLMIKYRLNPFTVTPNELNTTLSEKDKEKFIAKSPEKYKNALKEYLK